MKFNKLFYARKGVVLAALLGAATLSGGCVAVGKVLVANYHMMEGKVVRLAVYDGRAKGGPEESAKVGRAVNGKPFLEIYGGIMPSAEMVVPYRWAEVAAPGAWKAGTFLGNGPQGHVAARVADGVPFLKVGDWVDVYVPKNLSHAQHRWLTVIKLVCKTEDKQCQARESKAAGKPKGQVVAETLPGGVEPALTPHYDMAGNWLPGKKPSRP